MFSIITEIKNLKRPNFFLVPYQKYIYNTFSTLRSAGKWDGEPDAETARIRKESGKSGDLRKKNVRCG